MKRLPLDPPDTVQFSRMVRRFRFFEAMSIVMLERVLEGLQLFAFEAREKVCAQGDSGDSFFVVQVGTLEVTVRKDPKTRPRRVATLEPGDCFGEMSLLRQAPRNATVACLAPSRVFVLPARHFQAVLAQNPDFSEKIQTLAEARQFELDHP
ncbi:MAG: cyclic nucleotide-binding domain-containing protein [Acidobacteria bacterium]|nr:cyclic nucleotide-binding domain-containing protein [Acidobacteriota bacterium]